MSTSRRESGGYLNFDLDLHLVIHSLTRSLALALFARAIGGMEGVYCNGRLTGFELVGEKGSKVPNLTIGEY